MSRRNHSPDHILRRTASADIGLGEQQPPHGDIRDDPPDPHRLTQVPASYRPGWNTGRASTLGAMLRIPS
jgi:hypothetical protein